ncbi:polysaccharide deacetylase family protein [Kitasatospora kifunensis]|uniref:Peptidoglycan/xylan/chitin deacetylase (PgdA/CDA1 family) n=1 Tax=Kitasatospora kifunensis TaxID=58351 RepID=A0A7W7R6S2_KITKI|nr:polysaccharide deacetylase family protein [Kitasatospora kifunensis]MBB4926284.1 peptidoglycan/xylan/chitin deacetylase (PgdA/CDA1 family) [Kitasatospora kifunensis]
MNTTTSADSSTDRPRVTVTTSWDDGHVLDPRLAALLSRYRLPGTFYIAPRNLEFAPADRLPAAGIRELAEQFEIGGHTLTHRRLPQLSDAAAAEEIRTGRIELEDIIGRPVTSFCYPRGEYTPEQVQLVEQAGFTLARTVRRSSLAPGRALELGTTVNAYAHRVDGPLALRLAAGRPWRAARLFLAWDELAIHWFDRCLREGGVFHLWGHSWEVEARGDWWRLERVLAHIAFRPQVAYRTNRELLQLAA